MGEYDKYFNKDLHKDLNKNSHIKHVIAVTSGKGGVGKSLMTSLLAVMMNRIGYNVGILDADITGPSIPQAFGLTEKLYGCDKGIIPAETRTGIKIVSLNLMLDNPTDPVVWRGSLISNTVTQFWTDVYWGELDYLLICLRNWRCSSNSLPISSCRWYYYGIFTTGTCQHGCRKISEYGTDDEYSYSRSC